MSLYGKTYEICIYGIVKKAVEMTTLKFQTFHTFTGF